MPTHFAFRVSTYLTLILACFCLGYAEWDFLREASLFSGLVIALLVVSFFCEERYQLDLAAANRVGLVIGLVGTVWLAYQFINKNSLIYTFPWPASLLPFLGPLLMILMPAKMFRPKHVGDWWAMQGIGLAAMGLASTLAEDVTFGVMLGLYVIAGVWSLNIFFYHRVGGTLAPLPNTDPGPTPTILASSNTVEDIRLGRQFLARTLIWIAAALLLALPFFFVTPRSQGSRWQFMKPVLETGYASDQSVDMNRTGDLKTNHEVAFEVRATARTGEPKLDLDPNQRFRGVSFNVYDKGIWSRKNADQIYTHGANVLVVNASPFVPPDFGPDQFQLDFVPKMDPKKKLDFVVADPVIWAVNEKPPLGTIKANESRSWHQDLDGTFRMFGITLQVGETLYYRQVTRYNPGEDRDLGSPFELLVPFQPLGGTQSPDNPTVVARVVTSTRLKKWCQDLLANLAEQNPELRKAQDRAMTTPVFQVAAQDFETVAKAFRSYLARSGEFEYTLKLRRQDKGLDPVEEFLYRTKEGHCERFAAALVLMSRSVGIPANYVLGFKGWDSGDEPGVYLVRQEHTHAWAEVLVPRPAPVDFPFEKPPQIESGKPIVWQWLSLDPTPDGGTETPTPSSWIANARETGVSFFMDFIVGYNSDRRNASVQSARDWLVETGWKFIAFPVVLLVSLVFVALLWRRGKRRLLASRAAFSGVVWYDELHTLLEAHGLKLTDGQTPREYAVVATDWLRQQAVTRDVADLPLDVVSQFYLTRFAKRSLTSEQSADLSAKVHQLGDRLQKHSLRFV